ncbi:unnamed protein product [Microthlaspi erraticum]|uniref:FBD domain-containing protein n=1 Tax=Microthlaspi erraticum TaxID=1685480 RepID=A0A6D2JHN8_9BRAS|nr:unnamed protein product [Microthlaspi erraticum]
MHFQDVWYDADDSLIMEKIISACPVLEDLTFIMTYDHEHEFQLSLTVRSQSLKGFWFQNSIDGAAFKVEIDAPRLECLCLIDSVSDVIVVKHLSALLKIYVASDFNTEYGASLGPEDARKRYIISDFLAKVSSVRHMTITGATLSALFRYSDFATIPIFNSLYILEASFHSSKLHFLPVFLKSFPNMKTLILTVSVGLIGYTEPELSEFTYVPPCVSSSLECVEMKNLTIEEETWKKLARYFLENSALLKKLILRFKGSAISKQDSDIFRGLLTFTNPSRSCQIFIC